MDLKHLLSLYIAELEAAGDQSRDQLLEKNPDLSGELNRFFQFMDRAQSQAEAATIDVQVGHENSKEPVDNRTAIASAAPRDSSASSDSIESTLDVNSTVTRSPQSNTIGNYKLLQLIAEGGMGAVWLAEQQRPVRRRVALKLIKSGRDSDQIIARFDAERQALAMMEHQNIAKMLDAGQTPDGMPYFVMELVQGLPITHYCDRNCLTLEERLQLFVPVCQAIQHAHQKGIIHRDLKPSNVLVTLYDSQPVPKVIDFGLAKATEHQIRLTDKTMFTEFGQIVGTLQYMSPEQAELNSLDVDTRTDVYALGVLLYELLTGSTPLESTSFVNVSILKVLETIRTQEPPRPSTRLSSSGEALIGISQQRRITTDKLQATLRSDLDWVVMKALEKDRTRRYETASALADDVQRYLNNEPLHARPPSAAYLAQKFIRKHRAAVVAASFMFGLLVFGLTGTAIGLSRALAAKARESQARGVAEANLERAVQAESAERQRSTELQQRSEDLEKLTQFQQEQIRSIDASKMGRELRARLLKELSQNSKLQTPASAETLQPASDLQLSLSNINFTDVATEALRSNIFEPALEAVKKNYADQPAFQAKMLYTMAYTMRSTGIYDARPIELCVAIREKIFGPEAEETIDAKLEMAHLLSDQGEWIACQKLYQEMLDTSRRVLGSNHRLTMEARGAYAGALHDLGQDLQSVELHRENLELRRKWHAADSKEVMTSMGDLAIGLTGLKEYAEAETLHRQVLAMQIAKHGEKSREVYNCKHNLGKLLYDQEQYEAARKLDEEVVAGFSELLGELHPDTLMAKSNLAGNYFVQGQIDNALKLYRGVLVQMEETFGTEHPQTLSTASNAALCLQQLGKFEDSESLYKDTIEKQRRVLGKSHPKLLKTIYQLGGLYANHDRFEQATPWFRQYVEATADHDASCILINCLLNQNKDSEAEQVAAEMRRRAEEKFRHRPNELAISLGEIAQVFYEQQRYTAAKPILLEAQRLFIETQDRSSDAADDVETMLSIFNRE